MAYLYRTRKKLIMAVIRLQQASLYAEGPASRVPDQVKAAIGRQSLVIGFTELASDVDIDAVHRICAERDFTMFKGSHDTAIAWDRHAALVDKGEIATGASRSLIWVTLDYEGERITVVEQHWVTATYDKAHAGETRQKQSQVMIDTVKAHAGGHDLAFWMGDVNADFGNPKDTIRLTLGKAGLVSSFEAQNSFGDTLGKRTCDVVGHCQPDTRVRAVVTKVWPKTGSDHSPVTADYSIRPKRS